MRSARGEARSPNGSNGRDAHGRFAKGNPGGRGNPHAAHVGQLRSALMAAVKPKDIRAVAARLVQMAKDGDVRAIKELLDRTLGRPQEADMIERLERLEELLMNGQIR